MPLSDRQSLMAGLLIGLGACGFLALGGLPGAIIFAFGLVGVVLSGTLLYTGRAGVMTNIPALIRIWFWNVVGCLLLGLLVVAIGGDMASSAQKVVAGRLAQGPWRSLIRAVGCGLIIDIAVWLYRSTKSIVPVLFGVPLFIVCGFYHSIADVVYLVAAWKWDNAILWYYPIIVIGNYLGCNVRRVLLPESNAKQ
ncbi:MAG: formate/nitrite transporter family protein [Bacteroidales bacterium]|nr:formate/nitrite transporter family protein [Bacteroidales bacterium]